MDFAATSSHDYIPLNHLSPSKQSILSTTTTSSTTTKSLLPSTSTATTQQQFIPSTTLTISTLGKLPFSSPLPPSELETPILSPTTNTPLYISIRPNRHSGNCYLIHPEKREEVLAWTEYKWGPLRWPIVKIPGSDDVNAQEGGEEEFEIKNPRLFSRTTRFHCSWGVFEWRYGRRKERGEGVDSLLVLEKVFEGGEGRRRERVAQLVRGVGTRTAGSGRWAAGNGGRLEVCLGGECSERVVLVTVLVMLKKEVDRMRGRQVAAFSGGGGGC